MLEIFTKQGGYLKNGNQIDSAKSIHKWKGGLITYLFLIDEKDYYFITIKCSKQVWFTQINI